MTPSKSALLLLFCCVLLPVLSLAQEGDEPWFWILADSVNSTATCPGRCLAVNDSGDGVYDNKPVVFVACKGSSSSSSSRSSSSESTNNNQQWLGGDNAGKPVEIKFNATAATDGQSTDILCLEPDPATSNRTLKVAACTGRGNQKWIVANNSIASQAFDPPRYLAMSYSLAGFLNATDGPIGWREATIFPSARPPNNSFTTTFSMVDGTQDPQTPLPVPVKEPLDSHNFIRNGGFEQSSYDFPNRTAELAMSESDPFSLCNWLVIKGDAKLRGGPDPAPSEGSRSLYLYDGIVKQNAATLSGAFYSLVFKVAVATPPLADGSDETNQCNNNDTLSVNPYPSTAVHVDVEVSNQNWTTKHVAFQALGSEVQLAFRGCATCGCHLDDVNLMQLLDSVPFPPPPLRPSPPQEPNYEEGNKEQPPPGPFGLGAGYPQSNRLSNGAVVGIVVGTSALFFMIGAACFGVLGGKKKEERNKSEIGMERPREWSIETTTPAQSQQAGRGNSSNAPISSTTVPARVSSSASTVGNSPPVSSSNPHSGSGA